MADIIKFAGFGGVGSVGSWGTPLNPAPATSATGQSLLLTSANVSRVKNVPKQVLFLAPSSQDFAGSIVTGIGTAIVNGSFSFDMKKGDETYFLTPKALQRNSCFGFSFKDSHAVAVTALNCVCTSLSVNASSGGLVTCSISFISGKDITKSGSVVDIWNDSYPPLLYNKVSASSGNHIMSLQLNYSMQANPVYLNGLAGTDVFPHYIRCGQATFSATIESIVDINFTSGSFAINIGDATLTIPKGVAENYTINHKGGGDIGSYSCTIVATRELSTDVLIQ